MYIRPENHYTENHWFVAASVPAKITRWWNLSVNAVGVMQRIRLNSTDSPATHYLMFADATCSFTLPAGFFAEAATVPKAASTRQQRGRPRHTLSATVKKQLFGKRLTLFCTLSNITGCDWEFASLTDGMRRTIDTASLVGGACGKSARPGISAPATNSAPAPSKARRKPSASAS